MVIRRLINLYLCMYAYTVPAPSKCFQVQGIDIILFILIQFQVEFYTVLYVFVLCKKVTGVVNLARTPCPWTTLLGLLGKLLIKNSVLRYFTGTMTKIK